MVNLPSSHGIQHVLVLSDSRIHMNLDIHTQTHRHTHIHTCVKVPKHGVACIHICVLTVKPRELGADSGGEDGVGVQHRI